MNTKFPTVSPSTIGREEKNFFFTSSSLQIEWYWKKYFILFSANRTRPENSKHSNLLPLSLCRWAPLAVLAVWVPHPSARWAPPLELIILFFPLFWTIVFNTKPLPSKFKNAGIPFLFDRFIFYFQTFSSASPLDSWCLSIFCSVSAD